jgi:hypothetical protein
MALEQAGQIPVLARLAQQPLERPHRRAMPGGELHRLAVPGDRLGRLAPLALAQLAHLGQQGDAGPAVGGGVQLPPVHLQQLVPVPRAVVEAPQARERGHERRLQLEGPQEPLLGPLGVVQVIVQDGAGPVEQAHHQLRLAGELGLSLQPLHQLGVPPRLLGDALERVQGAQAVALELEDAAVGVRRLHGRPPGRPPTGRRR